MSILFVYYPKNRLFKLVIIELYLIRFIVSDFLLHLERFSRTVCEYEW